MREYGKGFVTNGIETLVWVWLPVPRQRYQETGVINPMVKGIDENGVKYEYISGASKRNRNIFIGQLKDLYGYTATLFRL